MPSMTTGGAGAPGVSPFALEALTRDCQNELAALASLEQERSLQERAYRDQRAALVTARDLALAALAQETPPDLEDPEAIAAAASARRNRWRKRITDAATIRRRTVRQQLEQALRAVDEEPPPAVTRTAAMEKEIDQRTAAFATVMDELLQQNTTMDEDLEQLCRHCGIAAPEQPEIPATTAALPSWELPRLVGLLRNETGQAQEALAKLHDSSVYGWSTTTAVLVRHLVLLVPTGFLIFVFLKLLPNPPVVWWTAGVGVACQLLLVLLTITMRLLLRRRTRGLGQSQAALRARLTQLRASGLREIAAGLPLAQRLRTVDPEARERRLQQLRARAEAKIAQIREREARVLARLEGRTDVDLPATRQRVEAARAAWRQDHDARSAREHAAQAARLAACDRAWQERLASLRQRWHQGVARLCQDSEARLRAFRERQPLWTDPAWSSWQPASGFASEVAIGVVRHPLRPLLAEKGAETFGDCPDAELTLPVALAYPGLSSLLVRSGPGCRTQAVALLNQVLVRALACVQPGRLLLTLIDPIGLGDSFAPVLAVADQDPRLLGPGVLSDQARIERGLEDLVSHLELVIQKHLRGRYATIDDYNREAGEMQEPLRFVALCDFPGNCSERALDHVATLARSGARCGVHLLILHDDRKPLPSSFDLAAFRSAGIVLREARGQLVVDREALHGWSLEPDPLPAPELRASLIHRVSHGASAAQRIEVSFRAIAPPADQVWSQSTAKELRIPIGKRGADRLQYLELGKGTCQHVLIGGRTGSGKSTLFHVMVTSGALWHHPRELQLLLIDFKKGVEFKPYATHRLPHAQVVAIESDREFGLNVLRSLDAELTRRGEIFRSVGAHDLGGYRTAARADLPRLLLLIDEFQEFFTEDDAIARDAALLLDRFVRQGRAFGLHVILGSQTLGGAYALAKSSLGQMGVRIVLPCQEADGHLLLHEDNDAARLLTRPGDAIYNDRAGLVEGNSPFQVCWLPEEEQARDLAALAERQRREGWRPSRPPVVFEGNGPSHLEEDPGLAAALAAPTIATPRLVAGVGQSSALHGQAEVSFSDAAGANLLIVGQHRSAAAATCGAVILGLAARVPPAGIRLVAIDGEDQGGPFATLLGHLTELLPHAPVRHEARAAATVVGELHDLLQRRIRGEDPDRTPVVLFTFALQRLRSLRADDDAGMLGGEASAGERFATLIAQGPEHHVHVIAWCDSLASVQRCLPRRALKDFDRRILFQMSASDSMELVDEDGASRLGLHTAMLASLMEGTLEKFRPYAVPEREVIAAIGERVRARGPRAAGSAPVA